MENFNKEQETTPDTFDGQLKTAEPTVTPNEAFVDTTMEQVESSPRPRRHKRLPAILFGSLGASVAAIALFAFILVPGLTAKSSQSTPASTSSTAPATSNDSSVQTDDLTSDLNDAGQAVDQSSADQQATDNSLNDSSSQVAVPTE